MQNGDILVLAYEDCCRKWPLTECHNVDIDDLNIAGSDVDGKGHTSRASEYSIFTLFLLTDEMTSGSDCDRNNCIVWCCSRLSASVIGVQ